MEKYQIQKETDDDDRQPTAGQQPPNISPMVPVTKEAYGGGLYGKEEEGKRKQDNKPNENKPPASETQSADGPAEAATTTTVKLKHKTPPSSGDRGLDITGQSYIQ